MAWAPLSSAALGLVRLVFAGNKGKRARLRLARGLGGFVILLALWGCGGLPQQAVTANPAESYNITVTAAAGTVTATTNITLHVQ